MDVPEPSALSLTMGSCGVSVRHLGIVMDQAARLPYHNWRHCVRTALRAHRSATLYGIDSCPLLVAALYHDVRHLGPCARSDGENIARAVECWLELGRPAELAVAELMHREPPAWLADVPRLIVATRFPHTPTDAFDELVLRNADLAETLDPQWLEHYETETGGPAIPGFAEAHMVDLAAIARGRVSANRAAVA